MTSLFSGPQLALGLNVHGIEVSSAASLLTGLGVAATGAAQRRRSTTTKLLSGPEWVASLKAAQASRISRLAESKPTALTGLGAPDLPGSEFVVDRADETVSGGAATGDGRCAAWDGSVVVGGWFGSQDVLERFSLVD